MTVINPSPSVHSPVYIDGVGHSILTDYGTLIPDWSTARKFASALGISGLRLSAVGGAVLAYNNVGTNGDGGWAFVANRYPRNEKLTAPYLPKSQCVFVRYGVNDLGALGPSPTNLLPFKEAYRSILSMMRQAARWELETLPTMVTWGGVWVTDTGVAYPNYYASGTGYRGTTAIGATMTVTLPADWPAGATLAIGAVTGGVNDAKASYGVTINGAAQPDWTLPSGAKQFNTTAAATGRFTGNVLRIPNRSAGDVIVLTTKTLTSVAILDYVAMEMPAAQGYAPVTLAILENRATGYSNYNGSAYHPYTSTLNGATSVGAATFSVATPLAQAGTPGTPTIKVGDTITLEAGAANAETVTVQAVTGTGPWTVTPAAFGTTAPAITLTKAHASGVAITGGFQDADVATLNQQMKDVVAEFADPLTVTVGMDVNDGGPFAKQADWFFDTLHYNELGHQKAAETIYNKYSSMAIPLSALSSGNVPDRQTWLEVLSFLNGWVNYSVTPGEPRAQYIKDTFTNVVRLRGTVKSGTAYGAMFTLPAGYRPAVNIVLTEGIYSANGLARLTISTAGDVVCSYNCDPTFVSFECSFVAENP